MKPKNKKANIPVTILVLGILAVCGLAIFSFILGNSQTINKISDVSIVETAKIDGEKFYFYTEKLGLDEEVVWEVLSVEENEVYGKHLKREKGDVSVIYQFP